MTPDPKTRFTGQDALVAVMLATSASDENMRSSEMMSIERMVSHLPVFKDYDAARIAAVAEAVFELFEREDGLDTMFQRVRDALPDRMFEAAYAMACDVAAADGRAGEEELRMLEEIRYELELDRLHAAAIERGARVRHMVL